MEDIAKALSKTDSRSRSALSNRAVNSLKVLGSDKSGFRQWNDKLVNAMSTVSVLYRRLFTVLGKRLDRGEAAITTSLELLEVMDTAQFGGENPERFGDQANEDIYAV